MRLLTIAIVGLLAGCASPIMPEVRYATEKEMAAFACPKSDHRDCRRVRALYLHNEQVIVLPRDWSVESEYDLSTLVHEFVHHVQYLGGDFKARCLGDIERDAYHAQIAFLKSRGLDPYKTLGMDAFTVAGITGCWN